MARLLLLMAMMALCVPDAFAVELATEPGMQVAAKKKKRRKRRRRRRSKKRRRVKTVKPAPVKAPVATPPVVPKEEPKPADPRPGLAVLDLVTQQGMSTGTAQLLNDSVLVRLNDSGKFSSVLSSSDIKAMISMELQRSALGCEVDSCLAEIGGALGVPLMLVPTMGQVGDQIVFNIKVLNVEDAKVVVRETINLPNENSLLKVLPIMVDRVVAKCMGEEPPPMPKVEIPTVASGPVASSRTPLWLGVALGAGGAGLALLAPSNADLLAKRTQYEDEHNLIRREQQFNELQALNNEAVLMRVSGAVVGLGGIGLATWSVLQQRGRGKVAKVASETASVPPSAEAKK